MNRYVVATVHRWNIDLYANYSANLSGEWTLITDHTELTPHFLDRLQPRFIFFPHWSWRVPQDIIERYECVCFHMTDLPYGRGGTPLQNLILAGNDTTKITALRMTSDLDAGPVYAKEALSLDGRAQDIYERAALVTAGLIEQIVRDEPTPEPQLGEITTFARRTAAQSQMPDALRSNEIYDFIRMLDAESYPHAFLNTGRYRLEFSNATLANDCVRASVVIRVSPEVATDKDAQ